MCVFVSLLIEIALTSHYVCLFALGAEIALTSHYVCLSRFGCRDRVDFAFCVFVSLWVPSMLSNCGLDFSSLGVEFGCTLKCMQLQQ
jgi:hypothetical protein